MSRIAPAHWLAGSVCLGLATANLARLHLDPFAVAVVVAAAAAVGSAVGRFALVGVLLFSLGWTWASMRLDRLDHSALTASIGLAGRAVVVVTSQPRAGRFDVTATGVVRRFAGVDVDEPARLELRVGRSPPQGAVIEALAVLKEPRTPSNGFDERTWLRRHGMHVVVKVDSWRLAGHRTGLGGLADGLRRRLARAIAPRLTGERRAVLEGIVLGDDSGLSDGLRNDFRASGLYHILAVSGQNVVLVAAGVLMLAWLLGISRIVGEVGALAAIGGYVLAVGPQPSVIRAGVAGALASLAWLTGRLRDAWQALLLGAIALLAWNPYLVFDAGFQLSFVAVAAIFTVAPRFAAWLEATPLPRRLRLGVAVSAACSVVTAPILWLEFGYLPLLGVVANALVEPAMPLLLGLAFATAALTAVSPAAAAVAAALNGWVAEYIVLCARLVASLPAAQVSTTRGLAGAAGFATLAVCAWRRCMSTT